MKVLTIKKSSSSNDEISEAFVQELLDRGVVLTKNQDGCLEFFSNVRYFNLPRTIRQRISVEVRKQTDGCEIVVSKDANRSLWLLRTLVILLFAGFAVPQLLGYSNIYLLSVVVLLAGYLFFHLSKNSEFSAGSFCESLFEDISQKNGITFENVYLNREAGISNLLIPVVIAVLLASFVLQITGFYSVILLCLGVVAPLFFRSFRGIIPFTTTQYLILLYLLFIRFFEVFFQRINAPVKTSFEPHLVFLVANCFLLLFLGWLLNRYLRNVGQEHYAIQHFDASKVSQPWKLIAGMVFVFVYCYLWVYYVRFEWGLFLVTLPMALKALLVLTTLIPVVYVIFIFCENLRQVLQSTNLQKQSAEFDEFFTYRENKSNKESAYLRIPLLPGKKPILTIQGTPSFAVLNHELAHIRLGHILCLKWLNFASRWLLLGEGFFSLLYYRPSQIEDEADSYSNMEVTPELENLPVLEHKSSPSSNAFLRSLKYEYYQKWYLYHSRSHD